MRISSEKDLIERFFDGLDKYTPDLVSWNGAGFDLPVLHYRSLLHSVTAARYWELGDSDQQLQIQQLFEPVSLAAHGSDGHFVGFPGPRAGEPAATSPRCSAFRERWACTAPRCGAPICRAASTRIRDYCETDVLNTYLIYLRFELMRGHLNAAEHAHEIGARAQAADRVDTRRISKNSPQRGPDALT